MAEKKGNTITEEFERIMLENDDLNLLFSNAENILEYNLKYTENINELRDQLEIIGGKSFAAITTFILGRNKHLDTISKLSQLDVNKDLLNKFKILVAKFGPRYCSVKEKIDNEYGWSNIEYNIIHNNEDFYIEFIILLNNGKKITCRDNPDSMLLFLSNFIKPLISVGKSYSLNKELVSGFYNNVKELYEKCTDQKDEGSLN